LRNLPISLLRREAESHSRSHLDALTRPSRAGRRVRVFTPSFWHGSKCPRCSAVWSGSDPSEPNCHYPSELKRWAGGKMGQVPAQVHHSAALGRWVPQWYPINAWVGFLIGRTPRQSASRHPSRSDCDAHYRARTHRHTHNPQPTSLWVTAQWKPEPPFRGSSATAFSAGTVAGAWTHCLSGAMRCRFASTNSLTLRRGGQASLRCFRSWSWLRLLAFFPLPRFHLRWAPGALFPAVHLTTSADQDFPVNNSASGFPHTFLSHPHPTYPTLLGLSHT